MAPHGRRQRDDEGLGHTQKLILRLLLDEQTSEKSAARLAYDWPGLGTARARNAVMSLADRGLVDVAGFEGNARTFKLTARGREVARALDESEGW